MSAYNGRRGPNVSAYVANLNTIAPDEIEEPNTDFSLFLQTELFDQYDTANLDFNPSLDVDLSTIETPAPATQVPAASASDAKMDFNLNGDFQFADFSSFAQPLSLDPTIQAPLPAQRTYSLSGTYTSPTSSAVSPLLPGFDATPGKKRKHDATAAPETPNQLPADDSARGAADEDKRRRNTAASARFRIKKKQREQALEKTAKEMTDRVSVLETRIQQLETENTWLKGLITEKNGGKASPSEIQARLVRREESERSSGNRTDGVGTKAGKA